MLCSVMLYCTRVRAIVVYLAMYGIYVIVVVFGRIIYQYQKQKAVTQIQHRSINSVTDNGESTVLLFCSLD